MLTSLTRVTVTRAFPLQPVGTRWRIESGKLDIFLAPMRNGEPAGALTFIIRVEAGQSVFGLPVDPGTGFGFCAAPAAETTLEVLPAAECDPGEQPWRTALTEAVGVADDPPQDREAFHQWAAEQFIARRREADSAETERLNARLRADEKLVAGALRRLSDQSGTVALSLSPLAAACQAVAAVAGIDLKIPASVAQGKSPDPLRAITRHSSVRSRHLLLRGEWWKEDSGPMLGFVQNDAQNGGDPVALLPRPRGGYNIYNPATGTTTRINNAVAQTLTGAARIFYRPFPAVPLSGRMILATGLRGCGRDLRVILLAGMLGSLLNLVTPYATGIVFDTIIPGSERDQLLQVIVLIVACAIATTLITLTRSYAMLRVEGRLDFVTQAALWDRLLNLPVTFFKDYTAGDLAARSMAVSQMRALLTGTTLSAILSGIFAISSLLLLFHYSVTLALTGAALAAFAFAVTVGGGYLVFRLQRRIVERSGKISGMVFQFIEGIAKFKVSGTEGRAFARWAEAFAEQKNTDFQARRISNVLAVIQSAFPTVAACIVFSGAASLRATPGTGLSTGEFLAFNAAFMQLLVAVLGFGSGVLAVFRLAPLYARAQPIFETVPETGGDQADPGTLTGNIEANSLKFSYGPDLPMVLRGVSFTIRPGEFVAFVGSSGSGKSTLLRLMMGFEKPASGALYFDGQDLAGLDLEQLRQQMGVVLQNGKLLPGDILTNIIGSAPMTTIDDAWEAARMAGMEEDLKALPMGMYTVVAEGGKGLSGGQRQRLMIARAVVRKPKLLMFDEATSALDNRTQETVSRAMEQMQVTRVVIAHRLSTIRKADRIFVLDQGVIVQTGTYDELIDQPGLFQDLAKRQLA